MKKKKLHKVMTIHYNKKRGFFIEAGRVENATHHDNYYFMINGNITSDCWEIRKDEALSLITCLSAALNEKTFEYTDLSEKGGDAQ